MSYFDLQQAIKKRDANFDWYYKQCEGFVRNFQKNFEAYLAQDIVWVAFEGINTYEGQKNLENGLNQKITGNSSNGRLIHLDDTSCYFKFKIDTGLSEDPIDFINIHFRLRKTDDHFILRYYQEEKKEVQNTEEALKELSETLIKHLIEHFDTDFDNFMHGRRRTLGFQYPIEE